MSPITPVLLLILDGFGHRPDGEDNAILHAQTPHLDKLRQDYAYGTIDASEHSVGLPNGQFGNSEVGHLNIGAGRVVRQDITRIDSDIEAGTFASQPVIAEAIKRAKGHTLHLMGLLSDGGVHAHENHFHALIRAAHQNGVERIRIHAFLDGRDTPPKSAELYLKRLDAVCVDNPGARLATVSGRYWGLDRDLRWERVEPVYRLMVDGEAEYRAVSGLDALNLAYERGETDEFVLPTVIGSRSPIEDGDVVVFMNYRADRARELTTALTGPYFNAFTARRPQLGYFATLTSYGANYINPVVYPPQKLVNGFGEYLARLGLKQLRIAETEKYPHVTYFFNGGEEQEYPGETRILVQSPKVATYDLKPEMSAPEVTDRIVDAIHSGQYQAIICNYANGDMVGHTGVFDAAVKAVETLDQCVARCVAAMQQAGGEVLITADHGNCERMYDAAHHQPHTQHTLDVVPFLYVGRKAAVRPGGALKDIAPSLLAMMGVPKPDEMTGESLIDFQ
ncbi:2,3-bisphosphoglycerate-independent phosphoglycerate mutase [Neisseriaceae bacterium JH1-16]|nr:2,3-bisphosphoglycerate-independent phosphoglycerate mutase [Neisseriaceae bacterium JH1-16]